MMTDSITSSREYDAPPERLWAIVGDFSAPQKWLPGVADCRIERDGSSEVRHVTTVDGAQISEKLVERDDAGRRVHYAMDVAEGPIAAMRVSASVEPSGSGSRVTLHADADARAGEDAGPALNYVKSNFYEVALDNLATLVA